MRLGKYIIIGYIGVVSTIQNDVPKYNDTLDKLCHGDVFLFCHTAVGLLANAEHYNGQDDARAHEQRTLAVKIANAELMVGLDNFDYKTMFIIKYVFDSTLRRYILKIK